MKGGQISPDLLRIAKKMTCTTDDLVEPEELWGFYTHFTMGELHIPAPRWSLKGAMSSIRETLDAFKQSHIPLIPSVPEPMLGRVVS